jgi:pyridoxine 5-phosphate synthase
VMIDIALKIRPELVTLVPEKREELTTEGGLDLHTNKAVVSKTVGALRDGGIAVSIFVDPDPDQIRLAQEIQADVVEVHTGIFCDARDPERRLDAFNKIKEAVKLAHELRLGINAGHGLGYDTIKAFKGLAEIDEFSIGHSIIARAVLVGLDRAVRDMVRLIKEL